MTQHQDGVRMVRARARVTIQCFVESNGTAEQSVKVSGKGLDIMTYNHGPNAKTSQKE